MNPWFFFVSKQNCSFNQLKQLFCLLALLAFVQFSRCERLSLSVQSLFFCGFKPLVGSSGLEPPTSRLSGVRSNHLSYEPMFAAEHGQLTFVRPSFALRTFLRYACVLTLTFVSLCTRLVCGFKPLVEMNGFEPMTPCLQSRCSPS